MDAKLSEARIHRIFQASVALKGAHALLECVAGISLALVSTSAISALVVRLTQHELDEDPHDLIAASLAKWASGFSLASKDFYSWYLLSHGAVKLVLVVALLMNKVWAYPLSIIVLALFVAYQVYRYTFEPSLGLVALSVFDLVVIGLVWHEYRIVRKLGASAATKRRGTESL